MFLIFAHRAAVSPSYIRRLLQYDFELIRYDSNIIQTSFEPTTTTSITTEQ